MMYGMRYNIENSELGGYQAQPTETPTSQASTIKSLPDGAEGLLGLDTASWASCSEYSESMQESVYTTENPNLVQLDCLNDMGEVIYHGSGNGSGSPTSEQSKPQQRNDNHQSHSRRMDRSSGYDKEKEHRKNSNSSRSRRNRSSRPSESNSDPSCNAKSNEEEKDNNNVEGEAAAPKKSKKEKQPLYLLLECNKEEGEDTPSTLGSKSRCVFQPPKHSEVAGLPFNEDNRITNNKLESPVKKHPPIKEESSVAEKLPITDGIAIKEKSPVKEEPTITKEDEPASTGNRPEPTETLLSVLSSSTHNKNKVKGTNQSQSQSLFQPQPQNQLRKQQRPRRHHSDEIHHRGHSSSCDPTDQGEHRRRRLRRNKSSEGCSGEVAQLREHAAMSLTSMENRECSESYRRAGSAAERDHDNINRRCRRRRVNGERERDLNRKRDHNRVRDRDRDHSRLNSSQHRAHNEHNPRSKPKNYSEKEILTPNTSTDAPINPSLLTEEGAEQKDAQCALPNANLLAHSSTVATSGQASTRDMNYNRRRLNKSCSVRISSRPATETNTDARRKVMRARSHYGDLIPAPKRSDRPVRNNQLNRARSERINMDLTANTTRDSGRRRHPPPARRCQRNNSASQDENDNMHNPNSNNLNNRSNHTPAERDPQRNPMQMSSSESNSQSIRTSADLDNPHSDNGAQQDKDDKKIQSRSRNKDNRDHYRREEEDNIHHRRRERRHGHKSLPTRHSSSRECTGGKDHERDHHASTRRRIKESKSDMGGDLAKMRKYATQQKSSQQLKDGEAGDRMRRSDVPRRSSRSREEHEHRKRRSRSMDESNNHPPPDLHTPADRNISTHNNAKGSIGGSSHHSSEQRIREPTGRHHRKIKYNRQPHDNSVDCENIVVSLTEQNSNGNPTIPLTELQRSDNSIPPSNLQPNDTKEAYDVPLPTELHRSRSAVMKGSNNYRCSRISGTEAEIAKGKSNPEGVSPCSNPQNDKDKVGIDFGQNENNEVDGIACDQGGFESKSDNSHQQEANCLAEDGLKRSSFRSQDSRKAFEIMCGQHANGEKGGGRDNHDFDDDNDDDDDNSIGLLDHIMKQHTVDPSANDNMEASLSSISRRSLSMTHGKTSECDNEDESKAAEKNMMQRRSFSMSHTDLAFEPEQITRNTSEPLPQPERPTIQRGLMKTQSMFLAKPKSSTSCAPHSQKDDPNLSNIAAANKKNSWKMELQSLKAFAKKNIFGTRSKPRPESSSAMMAVIDSSESSCLELLDNVHAKRRFLLDSDEQDSDGDDNDLSSAPNSVLLSISNQSKNFNEENDSNTDTPQPIALTGNSVFGKDNTCVKRSLSFSSNPPSCSENEKQDDFFQIPDVDSEQKIDISIKGENSNENENAKQEDECEDDDMSIDLKSHIMKHGPAVETLANSCEAPLNSTPRRSLSMSHATLSFDDEEDEENDEKKERDPANPCRRFQRSFSMSRGEREDQSPSSVLDNNNIQLGMGKVEGIDGSSDGTIKFQRGILQKAKSMRPGGFGSDINSRRGGKGKNKAGKDKKSTMKKELISLKEFARKSIFGMRGHTEPSEASRSKIKTSNKNDCSQTQPTASSSPDNTEDNASKGGLSITLNQPLPRPRMSFTAGNFGRRKQHISLLDDCDFDEDDSD